MQDAILYILIAGFLTGVGVASLYTIPPAALYGVVVFAVAFFALFFFRRTDRRERYLFAALFCFVLLCGFVRVSLVEEAFSHDEFASVVGNRVIFEGIVVDEPDVRETNTHLVVRPIELGDESISMRGKVIVFAPRYPEVRYGDRLLVEGMLKKPESFETDVGRIFDYPTYLKKDGIIYQISFPTITVLDHGHGNPVFRALYAVKHAFIRSIDMVIPEPEASLLAGLVVGAKESLGENLMDDFRTTGIVHIVVLSGYNITIVAEAIMRVLGLLPRLMALSAGGVSIVLFAIMTGASATIVRASLMALLVILARVTGRTYMVVKALCISAFFMVLYSPYVLLFDPSFQLSFLATLGLILFSPLVEAKLSMIPAWWGLRDVAIATIATQVTVLPLLLYMTGTLSLFALPVNLLVLLVVPFAMLAGFVTGVVGLLSTWLALPFGYVTYGILSYILFVVDVFARIPFATLSFPLPLSLMLLVYACLGLLAWRLLRA